MNRAMIAIFLIGAAVIPSRAETEIADPLQLTNMAIREQQKGDFTEAVRLLEKAAEKQDPRAELELARLYSLGKGTVRDVEKAAELTRRAAQKGYGPAQLSLARLYMRGSGVPIDFVEGLAWHMVAARAGGKRALDELAAAEAVFASGKVGIGGFDGVVRDMGPENGRKFLARARKRAASLPPKKIKTRSTASTFAAAGVDVAKLDDSSSRFAALKLHAAEGATRANLGSLRVASSIHYGETAGYYPKNFGVLVPRLTPAVVPPVSTGHHTETNEARIYDGSVCGAGAAVDKAKLKDTGKWGMVVDEKASCNGALFVDCTHTDSRGKVWADY